MTARPYELLARFKADGTVAGCHVRTIETINGKDFESDPVPLADATHPSFISFATAFSASAVAEKESLASAHKTALDAKEAELTTANATIAALESRVASLLAELPFNPKIIDAAAFYNRITKEEFAELLTSDDANKVNIGNTIMAYVKNDWPIVFESPEFQGMIGYLLSVGFSAERVAQLTTDATRDEAYDAA